MRKINNRLRPLKFPNEMNVDLSKTESNIVFKNITLQCFETFLFIERFERTRAIERYLKTTKLSILLLQEKQR